MDGLKFPRLCHIFSSKTGNMSSSQSLVSFVTAAPRFVNFVVQRETHEVQVDPISRPNSWAFKRDSVDDRLLITLHGSRPFSDVLNL